MSSATGPRRVLVIGSGGREHAIAWRLAREPGVEAITVASGNAGMVDVATVREDVAASDHSAVVDLARELDIDLCVIGPEAPLADGLADRLAEAGFLVFGPSAEAARLEASKSFCREVAAAAGVPMADGAAFDDATDAIRFARSLGGSVVVKADGLAGGKGVSVCPTVAEAEPAIRDAMIVGVFGSAGTRVVVERALVGREASLVCLTDGMVSVALPPARDHKRLVDGDAGPNTGGMGAYSPLEDLPDQLAAGLARRFHEPLLAELARRGIDYRGALYAGLMLTEAGPHLLECNVRLGDPETQVMLPRLSTALGPLLLAAAAGNLRPGVVAAEGAAVGIALAAAGYPAASRAGDAISVAHDPALVFWSGVRSSPTGGLETAGGRVATVVGVETDLAAASAMAYRDAEGITFAGRHFRRDIGRAPVLSGAVA